jgi:hypothetical protein
MRALSSTHDICVETDGIACGTATVTTTPITSTDFRIVTQTTTYGVCLGGSGTGCVTSNADSETCTYSTLPTCLDSNAGTTCNTHYATQLTCETTDGSTARVDGLGVQCDWTAGTLRNDGHASSATNCLWQQQTAKLMDPREVDIGDRIRVMIAGEGAPSGTTATAPKWETRTIDSVTYGADGETSSFSVSTAYSAGHTGAGRSFYNDGSGTMEVSTCSNRGLCDESTGECACFAGYTDVDCSHQNALSI